jgi:CheY-like chemotaxis protein/signal transduction histidine kinase
MIRARITQLATDFLSGISSPALVATPLGEIIFANNQWISTFDLATSGSISEAKPSLTLQQHLSNLGLTSEKIDDWTNRSLQFKPADTSTTDNLNLPLPDHPFVLSFKPIRYEGVVLLLLTATFISNGAPRQTTEITYPSTRLDHDSFGAAAQLGYSFMKGMGHEYRTPLSSIAGFLELALIEPIAEPVRQHLLQAQHAAQSLLNIVSDVMELGDPDGILLPLQRRQIEIDILLERIVALVERRASERRLQLVTKIGEKNSRLIMADERRIGQLLLNCLLLIIEHATPRGGIVVYVEKQEEPLTESDGSDTLQISFGYWDDTITDQEVQRLFSSEFKSIDSNSTLCHLRLNLIRQLLDRLGGGIKVHHIPRCGLRLEIQLPIGLNEADDESRRIPTATPKLVRQLRVLVAEDNPTNARVVALMLEHLDARFIIVQNGLDAVTAFTEDETGFDLVLMDCQMPELDGFQATRAIRDVEANRPRRSKIVAMTAYALPGDKESCLAAGMDDYLSKPIRSEQLSAILEQL